MDQREQGSVVSQRESGRGLQVGKGLARKNHGVKMAIGKCLMWRHPINNVGDAALSPRSHLQKGRPIHDAALEESVSALGC